MKKLFLYTNQITKIENLEQLNLEILWLNDNKISQIEVTNLNYKKSHQYHFDKRKTNFQGFSHMTKLVELNLSQNRITTIGEKNIFK